MTSSPQLNSTFLKLLNYKASPILCPSFKHSRRMSMYTESLFPTSLCQGYRPSWDDLTELDFTPELNLIIRDNLGAVAPRAAIEGPLATSKIDHLAIVLPTALDVQKQYDALMQRGGTIVDLPRNWPQGNRCDVSIPQSDHKFIGTVSVHGTHITLLSPASPGDVLHVYLSRLNVKRALHHPAFLVPDIVEALSEVRRYFGDQVRQITPLAVDAGQLSQVFLKFGSDPRIVEMVQRENGFDGSFTCRNVATLTSGERVHSFSGTEAAQDGR
jgi:hypothetical protein